MTYLSFSQRCHQYDQLKMKRTLIDITCNCVWLSGKLPTKHKKGLLLSNPVMTVSGTFGYGTEYSHMFDIQKLGAIICKGTTLELREGNPQPRVTETASGMLNSIGLQNIGVDALINEKAPI